MAKLTEKQKRFCDEYLIDLNATQAAIRAGYSKKTANRIGTENLSKPVIQKYIEQRLADREKRTEITQDNVLKILWNVATADPNEIINLSRVCCRNCYGDGFRYQWVNEHEYDRAVMLVKDGDTLPLDIGGYGFNPKRKPNPECPYCFGDGHLSRNINDTNELSEQGKALYAGFKETQAGIEIKMKDQMKALELVGRHLGMFTDKIEHSGGVNIKNQYENMSEAELQELVKNYEKINGSG